MIDGLNGIDNKDHIIKSKLEKFQNKKIILVANKADNDEIMGEMINEIYKFW